MAKMNYFKEVARYQKAHPRVTHDAAMAAVSKLRKGKVSGVRKKRKVAGTASVGKPRKRRVVAKVAGKAVGRVGASRSTGSALTRGNKIISRINTLEAQRKAAKGQMKKDLIQTEINSLHKKFDQLLKQKSA
jgi:hypothetical protein